jgi:membrane-bound metal-dependent hydrolase YbcI (DUF457 family)
MWPWGHLAIGYLLYTAFVHLRDRRPPTGLAALALAVGTQFPDLVDKPLAWSFGVLPNGRSLTHSLITTLLLVALVELVARRRGYGSIATAFAVGYLSHLAADALYPALSGDIYSLGFLAWPILPPVEYETEQSFIVHLTQVSLDSSVAFELGLGLAVFLLWFADGAPGLDFVTAVPKWLGRKLSA